MAHAHAARDRRGDEPRRPRGGEGTASDGKAAYLEDMKSSNSQMKRPSAGASLSWRCACSSCTGLDKFSVCCTGSGVAMHRHLFSSFFVEAPHDDLQPALLKLR